MLKALWVFVEALNAGLDNRGRIRTAALLTALAIAAREAADSNAAARKLVLALSESIVITGLTVEGAGAVAFVS